MDKMNFTGVLNEVFAERHRQIYVEGFDLHSDDGKDQCQLASAAAAYVLSAAAPEDESRTSYILTHLWPPQWDESWFKPTTARRSLVKAAALIVAEIERLDRAEHRLANSEETSVRVAHIAAIGLRSPDSLTADQIRTVCASALTQAPDQAKPAA